GGFPATLERVPQCRGPFHGVCSHLNLPRILMELFGLEWWQILLVLLAGFWAGTINSVVGSGTLVTFPVLVAVGFPPVTAQISNAMGLRSEEHTSELQSRFD